MTSSQRMAAVAVVVSLVLAACGGTSPVPAGRSEPSQSSSTATPAPHDVLCEEPERFDVLVADVTQPQSDSGGAEHIARFIAAPAPAKQIIRSIGECIAWRWESGTTEPRVAPTTVAVRGTSREEYRFLSREGGAFEELPLDGPLFGDATVVFTLDDATLRLRPPQPVGRFVVPDSIDPSEPLSLQWTPAEEGGDRVRIELRQPNSPYETMIDCEGADSGTLTVLPGMLALLGRETFQVDLIVSRQRSSGVRLANGRAACATAAVERRLGALPFGTAADLARHAARGSECWDDADCPAEVPACASVDRHGALVGRGPVRRTCLGVCTDRSCANGFACQPRQRARLVDGPDGSRRLELLGEDLLCVREPAYGRRAAGDSCVWDDDCAAVAPYCVRAPSARVCAAPCGDGCPPETRCQVFQRLGQHEAHSEGFCIPDREPGR